MEFRRVKKFLIVSGLLLGFFTIRREGVFRKIVELRIFKC